MKLSELYAECEGKTAAQKEKMVGICQHDKETNSIFKTREISGKLNLQ